MPSKRRQRILSIVLFASMGIRALIPAGYMPGNVFAGEFMVMCPSSSAAAIAGIHHHNHDDEPIDVDRACPIGSALTAIAPPLANNSVPETPRSTESYLPTATSPTVRLTAYRFRSRAPPHVQT
ncbi:MAG: hypothetical protein ACO22K_07565 [Woeseiaceae bacterium]|jgi:hypothetical protein